MPRSAATRASAAEASAAPFPPTTSHELRHDYLAQLAAFAARGPLPRVRPCTCRRHRPVPTNKGEFCALELDDGSLGLSYVLLDDTLDRLRGGGDGLGWPAPIRCAGAPLRQRRLFRKTLGFAAANALTRCLFDRAGFQPGQRRFDRPDGPAARRADRHDRPVPAAAGAHPGKRRAAHGGRTETGTGRRGGRLSRDAGRRELAACGKVVSTSTLLLNDTLDRMLGCCRNARWFAMVGPGAGCLPDALFARGVTLLGGSWIRDGAGFVDALKRGETTSPSASSRR
jgi:hypothetical protein